MFDVFCLYGYSLAPYAPVSVSHLADVSLGEKNDCIENVIMLSINWESEKERARKTTSLRLRFKEGSRGGGCWIYRDIYIGRVRERGERQQH